ncbi:hypothetical protein SS7213T_03625, partial [Staphylococcus simiae CCM 7213 = CCUG 51256]
ALPIPCCVSQFIEDFSIKIDDVMTKDNLITAPM